MTLLRGVLAAFKLANLLSFYRNTLAHIVGADAALVAAVEECRAAAQVGRCRLTPGRPRVDPSLTQA